jgi:hypothetical protein
MSVTYYSEKVRVRSGEVSPMTHASDITVEVLEGEKWVVRMSYNSMSNDYAYTESRKYAESLK